MRVADRLGQTAQRVERLRHLDEQRVVGRGDRAIDDRGARAARKCVGHEFVAIALITKGEEHLAWLDDPGIERAADESLVRARRALDNTPARRRK
jgi:hypothetical protein